MQPPDWTDLPAILAAILAAGGASEPVADVVAEHLVDSELAGRTTHGVRLLPAYALALKTGAVDGRAIPEVVTADGPCAIVDGRGGFAAPAGVLASQVGIVRAKQYGCVTVALRNVHHLGRIGRWSEAAASAGLVSLHFGHGFRSHPQVVPFGGVTAALGANPISIGLPSADFPIVLDISTAQASANAVRLAAELGKRLSEPSLVLPDGTCTDDPATFVEGVAGISVFGSHKGFGFSVAAEILAGAIAAGEQQQVGRDALLSVYIAPGRFCSPEAYDQFTEGLVGRLRRSGTTDGARSVRLPGEKSAANRRSAVSKRHRITSAAWDAAVNAAISVGAFDALSARWPAHFQKSG